MPTQALNHRIILIPVIDGSFDEVSFWQLSSINAILNEVLGNQINATFMYTQEVFKRYYRLEMLANNVANGDIQNVQLPLLQAQYGQGVLPTWSVPVTYGY
jgi:hypothetical protein